MHRHEACLKRIPVPASRIMRVSSTTDSTTLSHLSPEQRVCWPVWSLERGFSGPITQASSLSTLPSLSLLSRSARAIARPLLTTACAALAQVKPSLGLRKGWVTTALVLKSFIPAYLSTDWIKGFMAYVRGDFSPEEDRVDICTIWPNDLKGDDAVGGESAALRLDASSSLTPQARCTHVNWPNAAPQA